MTSKPKKKPIAKGKKVSPKKPKAVFTITISEHEDGSQKITASGQAHTTRLVYALSQVINQILGENLNVHAVNTKTKIS